MIFDFDIVEEIFHMDLFLIFFFLDLIIFTKK